jgi:hypothetical protein
VILQPTLIAGAQPELPDTPAVAAGDPSEGRGGRCGNRDFRTSPGKAHWSDKGFEFYINDANNPAGAKTTARILDGFRTWDQTLDACNSRKRDEWRSRYRGINRNVSISNTDDNTNMVGFSTGPEARKKCADESEEVEGTAIACAITQSFKFPGFAARIEKVDIIFNGGDFDYYNGRLTRNCTGEHYDVWNVSTHEVGHALGLDHIKDFGSVMYPQAWPCDDDGRILGRGDVRGVRYLY